MSETILDVLAVPAAIFGCVIVAALLAGLL